MLCNKCKMFVCLIALVAMLAWTGVASADIVASYAGPKEFHQEYQGLDAVSTIGLEGSVSLEFKRDVTSSGTLWYCADAGGGTGAAEYKIVQGTNSGGDYVAGFLWNSTSGYVAAVGFQPFTDTSSWHSLSFQWKQGSPTLITLDTTTKSYINTGDLTSFTSGAGDHGLGDMPGFGWHDYFGGSMRNVVVRDTYALSTPEPSTLVLLGLGLLGLLAYAWRKRK